jgi:2-hydroxychromene-2-carboxylate isomerase
VGVFGVPSFVVDGELFWGVDSIDLCDDFLNGRDPLTREVDHESG